MVWLIYPFYDYLEFPFVIYIINVLQSIFTLYLQLIGAKKQYVVQYNIYHCCKYRVVCHVAYRTFLYCICTIKDIGSDHIKLIIGIINKKDEIYRTILTK